MSWNRIGRLTGLMLVVVLGVLTLYCSWVPQPQMRQLSIIPDWIGYWADLPANKDLRTGVPFLLSGFLMPLVLNNKKGTMVLGGMLGLVLILMLAEAGQLFLKDRHFDWMDIAYGLTGMGLGAVFGWTLRAFWGRKRKSLKVRLR